jgi:ribonuclease R
VKHRESGGARDEHLPGGPVVAVLERRGRFLTAEPFFFRGRRMSVDRPRAGSAARQGDLVLVSPNGPRSGHAKVLRRIGRPDVARDVIEGMLLDRGLRRRFEPHVEKEARAAAEAPPETGSRLDLRSLPTFTIDPPTAKDFDDAISAEALEGGAVRVWVHIADVSHYVRPGSAVDREAFRRATSVYVPGTIEPMLPEVLSNGACSLVPGQDRLAVTVELEFEGATVRRTAFHRTVIRSDARLDYPKVDRVFAGSEPAEPAEAPWAEPLAAARRVASALQERREAQGALAVESVEPEFSFSREGHVTEQDASEQTESHTLIEHLMIAANEAVAGLLEARALPALYRVHERPEPARVERLADQLAALDVPTPALADPMTPQQAADAVGEISRLVDAEVRRRGHGRAALTSLVLRSLKQAHYSPKNVGHAGLRSPRYCHFTSPIRRYPDLICHRALLSAIGAGEDAPSASDMEGAGEWCSMRERDAMAIERRGDSIARCFLLEAELFESGWHTEFEGEVAGVIGAGAFVAFGRFEGLLPVRRLRGDWWELDELETQLVGAQSGNALRLGDRVVVQVERVDAPRGRVDLSPVEIALTSGD